MPFTDFIDRLELIPLDGNDLIVMSGKLGNPDCKWMQYDDLASASTIDDLFTPMSDGSDRENNTMYILLQIESGSGAPTGHWVSIIKYSGGDYDYGHYDSYGFTIDQELAFTHAQPLLQNLLTGVRLEESRVKHQLFKDKRHDVNTCGRHTVSRSVFYYLSNKEYDKLIIQPVLSDNDVRNPDVMVSLLTGFLPPNDSPVRDFFMGKARDINVGSMSRGTPF